MLNLSNVTDNITGHQTYESYFEASQNLNIVWLLVIRFT